MRREVGPGGLYRSERSMEMEVLEGYWSVTLSSTKVVVGLCDSGEEEEEEEKRRDLVNKGEEVLEFKRKWRQVEACFSKCLVSIFDIFFIYLALLVRDFRFSFSLFHWWTNKHSTAWVRPFEMIRNSTFIIIFYFPHTICGGDVAQMVERSLSMREVRGSIPRISISSGYSQTNSPPDIYLWSIFIAPKKCFHYNFINQRYFIRFDNFENYILNSYFLNFIYNFKNHIFYVFSVQLTENIKII